MATTEILSLQMRIAEAEMAKHQIAMGKQLVVLSYSAEGTNTQQWSQASLPALERHIADMKAQLARFTGVGVRGPIYIA